MPSIPSSLTPQTFADRWRRRTLKERPAHQEHLFDLCRLINHPTPTEVDPTGENCAAKLETAETLLGGRNVVDVFTRGFFTLECTNNHADLNKAYKQRLGNRKAIHYLPLLVVRHIERIISRFPEPPGREPQTDSHVSASAEAGRVLVQLRDARLNPPRIAEVDLNKRTLTNLYNARPTWLDHAHCKLDEAVFVAWPADLSDDDILEQRLALKLARATQQTGGA